MCSCRICSRKHSLSAKWSPPNEQKSILEKKKKNSKEEVLIEARILANNKAQIDFTLCCCFFLRIPAVEMLEQFR